MGKTTLKVQYRTTGGDVLQKSVTYANPEATDKTLSNFVKALTNLTSNTYISAERINVYDIEAAIAEAEREDEGGESAGA